MARLYVFDALRSAGGRARRRGRRRSDARNVGGGSSSSRLLVAPKPAIQGGIGEDLPFDNEAFDVVISNGCDIHAGDGLRARGSESDFSTLYTPW
jgi:hypothetical protein